MIASEELIQLNPSGAWAPELALNICEKAIFGKWLTKRLSEAKSSHGINTTRFEAWRTWNTNKEVTKNGSEE